MKLLSSSIIGLLLAGSVYGAASAVFGPSGWLYSGEAYTDNAYVRADVTPLSPKITGFISEVAVSDNQQVTKGQLLFRIEDNDYHAKVDQARAALSGKRAAIGNLDSRIEAQRAAVDQARAAVDGAKADADRAEKDYLRSSSLVKAGTTTQANVDLTESARLVAISKVGQAEANLVASEAQISVIESQRPQMLAEVEAAEASVRLAEIDLDSTVVRAPADGTVGERQARVGQLVKPGTSLIAFVSEGIWIVANFKETQLVEVMSGKRVKVEIDAVPGILFDGSVDSLSPASGAQFALLPPDNATGNFTRVVQRIPVRIALQSDQAGLERLRPGMSAKITGRRD